MSDDEDSGDEVGLFDLESDAENADGNAGAGVNPAPTRKSTRPRRATRRSAHSAMEEEEED